MGTMLITIIILGIITSLNNWIDTKAFSYPVINPFYEKEFYHDERKFGKGVAMEKANYGKYGLLLSEKESSDCKLTTCLI